MGTRIQPAVITIIGIAIGAVGALALPRGVPDRPSAAVAGTSSNSFDPAGAPTPTPAAPLHPSPDALKPAAAPPTGATQAAGGESSNRYQQVANDNNREISDILARIPELVRTERQRIEEANAPIAKVMADWTTMKAKVRLALPNSTIAAQLDAAGREVTKLYAVYLNAKKRLSDKLQALEQLTLADSAYADDPMTRAALAARLADDYSLLLVEHASASSDLTTYLHEVAAAAQKQVDSIARGR